MILRGNNWNKIDKIYTRRKNIKNRGVSLVSGTIRSFA